MREYIFSNGIKISYYNKPGNLTSFCMGFDAGALKEDSFPIGTAHALEHMIFKETLNRDEITINKECDEIFGFYNAMTNFPYVIYYGTLLSDNFEKGLELYCDIIKNPTFPTSGFSEEMSIIKEELKEWKDDIYQYCEDELLFNSFNKRRIKERIIGTQDSLNSIKIQDLKEFYQRYYKPENLIISIVTSLSFEESIDIVKKYLGEWNYKPNNVKVKEQYIFNEVNKEGIHKLNNAKTNGAKIQFAYSIQNLSIKELTALYMFDQYFGDGSSSMLFDSIRTKAGIAYDIHSEIRYEKGIELYYIKLGTSINNINKAINIINSKIEELKSNKNYLTTTQLEKIKNRIKIKRELKLEKTIEIAKELTVCKIMFDECNYFNNIIHTLNEIKVEDVYNICSKILKQPSIQIVT